jgi:hypothetical protein
VNSPHQMNNLTPILNIFVVRIDANKNLLFLKLDFSDFLLPFSNYEQKKKIKKNKICDQN